MKKQITSLPQKIDSKIISGDYLVGNDFNLDQITTWFSQEKEAYYSSDSDQDLVEDKWYKYCRFLNNKLGFSKLDFDKNDNFSVLVLGPGPGKEMEKFNDKFKNCTIYFLSS